MRPTLILGFPTSTMVVLLLAACSEMPPPPPIQPFDSLFAPQGRIELSVPEGVIGEAAAVLSWHDAIVLLDDAEANIKVFTQDGTYLRTLGRRGNGPREFQDPMSAVVLPNSKLAVLDGRRANVSLYDWPGIPDTIWSIGGYAPGGMTTLGPHIVIAAVTTDAASLAPASRPSVHAYTLDGRRVASYLTIPTPPAEFAGPFMAVRLGGNGRSVAAGRILGDSVYWSGPEPGTWTPVGIRQLGIPRPDWEVDGIRNIPELHEWSAHQIFLWRLNGLTDHEALVTFVNFEDTETWQYSHAVITRERMVTRTDWDPRFLAGRVGDGFASVTYRQDGSAALELYRLRFER